MTHRFFLPPAVFDAGEILFPQETARQISRVLRLKPGARVIALDNRGQQADVELSAVEPDRVAGRVLQVSPAGGEPRARLTLFLGLTQREKFEWMLQKCTEIGAAAFVPLVTQRSLVQDGREVERKRERWEAILREAAEQCGRGRIPELRPAQSWAAALRAVNKDHDLALAAWEGEHALRLRNALGGLKQHAAPRLAVLIGPEGGLSEEEISAASAAGVRAVSLGQRILRMETAAVVATALALDALEED